MLTLNYKNNELTQKIQFFNSKKLVPKQIQDDLKNLKSIYEIPFEHRDINKLLEYSDKDVIYFIDDFYRNQFKDMYKLLSSNKNLILFKDQNDYLIIINNEVYAYKSNNLCKTFFSMFLEIKTKHKKESEIDRELKKLNKNAELYIERLETDEKFQNYINSLFSYFDVTLYQKSNKDKRKEKLYYILYFQKNPNPMYLKKQKEEWNANTLKDLVKKVTKIELNIDDIYEPIDVQNMDVEILEKLALN